MSWRDGENDRHQPSEAPFDLAEGGGPQRPQVPPPHSPAPAPPAPASPAPLALLGSRSAVASDSLGPRPRTAPENAEWDLKAYEQRAAFYERRAGRLALVVVTLTAITAAIGGFTALLDEALLGAATGVLAACATGVEAWRTREKPERRGLAYRTGYVDIDSELDMFQNDAGQYGTVVQDAETASDAISSKRALLTERLAAINRRTEDALR